jgi:hypothetical protein
MKMAKDFLAIMKESENKAKAITFLKKNEKISINPSRNTLINV